MTDIIDELRWAVELETDKQIRDSFLDVLMSFLTLPVDNWEGYKKQWDLYSHSHQAVRHQKNFDRRGSPQS